MIYYADSDFYHNNYLCGRAAVIQTAADFYFREATQKIRLYTGSNVDESDIPEYVKMCCCEVAEKLYNAEQTDAAVGNVSSESVGGWSKSYESTSARKQRLEKEIRRVIYQWLTGTGLLYRGLR